MFHRQKHGPRVLRPARLSDDYPPPVPGPGCRHVWGMSQVRGGGWAVAGLLVWHDGWVVRPCAVPLPGVVVLLGAR